MTKFRLTLLALVTGCSCALVTVQSQQIADPNFDARVARPAYTRNHPKVLFDEAHNNFHTTTGRYKPFADLITNDGYSVTSNKERFSAKTLAGFDVLVIANALGAERQNLPEASNAAFSDEECDVVREWVRSGGSLLLIADHAPFGAAAEKMALRFGVEMSNGHTGDPINHDPETGNMTFVSFSRSNKMLLDHSITKGRDANEAINIVLSFTGQSLKGPAGSVAFLKLAASAFERQPADPKAQTVTMDRLPNGDALPPGVTIQGRKPGPSVSAAARAQGVAFTLGKGRVVVLGEAAMLSAQVVQGVAAQLSGQTEIKMGMNRGGIDNRQLALNIMHWLSRLLP